MYISILRLWGYLSSEILYITLEKKMVSRYKKNIERMGELMADGPLTAQQLAVYWTEYAIRHQGAAHLRAASADMPWHQLLLLDVLAVTVSSALVALWLVKISMSFIICSLFRRVKSKKD